MIDIKSKKKKKKNEENQVYSILRLFERKHN